MEIVKHREAEFLPDFLEAGVASANACNRSGRWSDEWSRLAAPGETRRACAWSKVISSWPAQHSVATWLVWLVFPISNLSHKRDLRKKKRKSDFYKLVTNSELFKTLRWPNKTCLLVVSSLRFKSVKDQPKHPSQRWIDLHLPILDVSCLLPLLQACF